MQLSAMNISQLMEKVSKFNSTSLKNISEQYKNAYHQQEMVRDIVIIIAYTIISVISLFSNLMVCHIIATNRKMHTITNCFIANLCVSDLLIALINIPFGVARLLLDQWPFGSFFCKFLPFIQATSV